MIPLLLCTAIFAVGRSEESDWSKRLEAFLQNSETAVGLDENAEKDGSANSFGNIKGVFYSGGGYVSHVKGAALTWAWNKYFTPDGNLADMFTDVTVSTNSGGGWFLNDMLYAQDFADLIDQPSKERVVELLQEYYYGLIAQVYDLTVDDVREKTGGEEYNHLGPGDYTRIYGRYSSWQELVERFHYMYSDEPILPVENMKWTSVIGLATEYNNYWLRTHVEELDQPQQSSWGRTIAGFFDFTFEQANQNPSIDISFPVFENEWAQTCSVRRTSTRCSDQSDCGDNSFCDVGLSACICSSGFHVSANGDSCEDCGVLPEGMDGPGMQAINSFDMYWDQWGFNPPPVEITVAELKQKVFDSMNDPKWYSGPSSTAGAAGATGGFAGASFRNLENVYAALGVEASWETAPLNEAFNDDHRNVPRFSLVDGGALDNCGITGLIRRIQEGVTPEEIEQIDMTVVGMCTRDEIAQLVTDFGDLSEDTYPVFELDGKDATLEWTGEITRVWGFRLRTLYDPMNGILPGSRFTLWAFEYPDDTPRGGLCSNWGISSSCPGNHMKHPDEYRAEMGLLPGRGEALEVAITAELIMNDMISLANHLGLTDDTPEVVFSPQCRTVDGTRCTGWYSGVQCEGDSCCQGTDYQGHGWCGTGPGPDSREWGRCLPVCDAVPGFDGSGLLPQTSGTLMRVLDSAPVETLIIPSFALVGALSIAYFIVNRACKKSEFTPIYDVEREEC